MTSEPHALAFSSDGARLALGYFGMQIWDIDQRNALFIVPLLWSPEAVRFSAMDSTLVIGCSYLGFLNFMGEPPEKIEFLRRSEYERMLVKDPKNFEADWNVLLHGRTGARPRVQDDTYCLAIYPDGKRFVAGGGPVFTGIPRDDSKESAVTVWDVATGRRLFQIGKNGLPILRFCLSHDGRTLYSCGSTVLGWDATKSGPPTQKFDAAGRRTLRVAVSSDGKMLAAGGSDGEVVIWDTENSAVRSANPRGRRGLLSGLLSDLDEARGRRGARRCYGVGHQVGADEAELGERASKATNDH